MKICIISREIYPFVKAGIAVYSYNLCRLLAKHGHDVTLVTDTYDSIQTLPDFKNIKVVEVTSSHPINEEIFSNFNLRYSFDVFSTLVNLTKTQTFDIIEGPDYFGEMFFTLQEKNERQFLKETPIVIKCHTPLYECLKSSKTPLFNYQNQINQENYVIEQADALYTISDALAQSLSKRLSLLKDFKILLNPLGLKQVNANTYHLGKKKEIVFVGKLQFLKGVDLLIKSAQRLLEEGLDFKVLFIGLDVEGYEEKFLNEVPDPLKSFFEFKGFLSREEIFGYFQRSYLSVFPSRWEGLGNVWIESVANGCPVLLSDAGGLKEMKKYGEFGLYFESESEEDLTDKLRILLKDETLRDYHARQCQEHAHIFLDEFIYQNQIIYYQSVIENKVEIQKSLTIETLMVKNLVHSIKLNQELHQEVLRLNHELGELYQRWEHLNALYEELKQPKEENKMNALDTEIIDD